jgi:hypothetical protein
VKALPPRYDRIVSLVLVVLLGLAVVLTIDSNPNILRARIGWDLPTITISWVLIGALVIISSTGADLLARAHPAMQNLNHPVVNLGFMQFEISPGFWILPSFSVIGSFAFFRLFRDSLPGIAFELSLIVTGGVLIGVLISQHYALARVAQTRQRAQLILQAITYLLAFGCFSAIYYARLRTLYSASLIGVSGWLLAYEVLQWTPRKGQGVLALIVGLVLGEVMWALNYWSASFLLGGALLLVIFYITVSLLQHQAAGTLKRHVFIEYGLLGSGLLAVVIYATFHAVP